MTPSPDEALHFRGKTLTPESPRPLHIPEPANIPVLENQMDPVFNDTSTYEPVYKATHGWSHGGLDGQGGPRQNQDAGSSHGSLNAQNGTISAPYYPPNSVSGTENPGLLSPGFSLPGPSYSHITPVDPVSQGFATESEVNDAQNTAQSRMPQRLNAEQDAGPLTGGVNFQNLLDNLSHPDPGATMAGVQTEPSSFHKAPVDEPLQSQGVPAHHAQAQSIQPHYNHNEVTYHQPQSAHGTANASQAYSAHSNPETQSQPQPYSIAGTNPTGNNLLPPTPGFQTPSSGPESQSSSQEASVQGLKKGRVDKQGRPIKGIDDDSPWGPEVQKKYDEFLHDERIYVTEGLWDRFPMGSRLFVGQYYLRRHFFLIN
jgi:hypothetical protein